MRLGGRETLIAGEVGETKDRLRVGIAVARPTPMAAGFGLKSWDQHASGHQTGELRIEAHQVGSSAAGEGVEGGEMMKPSRLGCGDPRDDTCLEGNVVRGEEASEAHREGRDTPEPGSRGALHAGTAPLCRCASELL